MNYEKLVIALPQPIIKQNIRTLPFDVNMYVCACLCLYVGGVCVYVCVCINIARKIEIKLINILPQTKSQRVRVHVAKTENS